MFSSLPPSFYLRLFLVLLFCLSLQVTAASWYPADAAPGNTASSRSLQAPGLQRHMQLCVHMGVHVCVHTCMHVCACTYACALSPPLWQRWHWGVALPAASARVV